MSTEVTSVAIVDSTVDSTVIGLTAPSTAQFITPGAGDNSQNAATTAWCLLGFAVSLGFPGYIKFPGWLSGFTLQWGTTGSCTNNVPTTVAFLTGFNSACLAVVLTDVFQGGISVEWSAYDWSAGSFVARSNNGTGAATFIAVGY